MRKLPARTGLNLSPLIAAHDLIPDQDPGMAVRMHAMRDGARAAAWLVHAHKARFVRNGEVDFRIPDEAETPAWLRVALEFLKRSPRHSARWQVTTFRTGGANDSPKHRTYRVAWLAFNYYREWRERCRPPSELRRPPFLSRTRRPG